jgi:hypothetical protein
MPDIQSVGRKAPDISATKCKIGVKNEGMMKTCGKLFQK